MWETFVPGPGLDTGSPVAVTLCMSDPHVDLVYIPRMSGIGPDLALIMITSDDGSFPNYIHKNTLWSSRGFRINLIWSALANSIRATSLNIPIGLPLVTWICLGWKSLTNFPWFLCLPMSHPLAQNPDHPKEVRLPCPFLYAIISPRLNINRGSRHSHRYSIVAQFPPLVAEHFQLMPRKSF